MSYISFDADERVDLTMTSNAPSRPTLEHRPSPMGPGFIRKTRFGIKEQTFVLSVRKKLHTCWRQSNGIDISLLVTGLLEASVVMEIIPPNLV